MKNALQILTLTTAIAICAAPAIVAQSSIEGGTETMSETPRTHNVAVPGASIYVKQRGSGPTLLLIPGGPQDAGVFAALARALSDQFTVIALDPRCNSRSPCDDMGSDLNVDQHVDDAAAVITAFGAVRVWFLAPAAARRSA